MTHQPTVEECVEHLCDQGCQQVRRTILALESGQTLPETAQLAPSEVASVLNELKSIMAVYGDTCRIS